MEVRSCLRKGLRADERPAKGIQLGGHAHAGTRCTNVNGLQDVWTSDGTSPFTNGNEWLCVRPIEADMDR